MRVQTEMTDKPTLMIASGANTATWCQSVSPSLAGERIEEIAIPVVEAVLHGELKYRDDHKEDRQRPCDHGGLATPKSAGARPEPDKPRTIRMTGVRHRPPPPGRRCLAPRGGAIAVSAYTAPPRAIVREMFFLKSIQMV